MTARIFFKLLSGIFALLLVALITVDYFASNVAAANYIENLRREMAEKGRIMSVSLGSDSNLYPNQLKVMAKAARARVTLVAPDGRVVADSEADPAMMENHRTRPELIEAFQGRQGSSIRHSPTLGVDFLYVAAPVPAGALRLAVPLSEINQQVNSVRNKILYSTALAFVPAVLIAALLARYLSGRFATITSFAGELAKGNFRARLTKVGGNEFGQLAHKLNETGQNLQKIAQQLEAEHAELEKLERVRKDFVINVSHELRTPLASIQGYTETLMDGALYDPEHNMRFLGIIKHNAERLSSLTADLLTLSRVELKRYHFQFEKRRVHELVAETLDILRPLADKKQIRLQIQPMAADIEVYCDPESVSQILSNLLDNAIKYTPEGGEITLGAHSTGNFAEVFVRDTGAGIPAEDLPRLFERFYRVDKARSRELGGTGLGLAIVKHLVLAHGGQVRVESVPGQGTTFYFTLPLQPLESGPGEHFQPEFTRT